MRTSLIGFVLAASCFMGVVGCDDDTSPADAAAADLSVTTPQHDLKTPPSQDGPAAAKNCIAVLTCVASCGSDAACVGACVASGTSSAQTKAQALIGCGYGQCLVPTDGGAASCTSAMDLQATCLACVRGQALTGMACKPDLTTCQADQ
jgi:hypothetical protein